MENPAPTCGLCDRTTSRTQKLNDGFLGFLCDACDLLSTNMEIAMQTSRLSGNPYGLEHRILTYSLRQREFQARYERLLELIGRLVPRKIGSILDVGGNIGYFANFVRQKNIFVETLEVLEDLRAFQRLAYGIHSYGAPEEIPVERHYDAIIMMDVLEHVRRPVDFLKQLKPHLAVGGVVFVQSPNKNSLMARISGDRWNWWQAPDHLHHFSEKSLKLVATRARFDVVLSRAVSPLLDDLVNLPFAGKLFAPLRVLGRWIDVNPTVPFRHGSLLQVLLLPDDRIAENCGVKRCIPFQNNCDGAIE